MKVNRRWLTVIGTLLFAVAVVFSLAACSDDDSTEEDAAHVEGDEHDDADHDAGPDTELVIQTSDTFAYNPDEATVATGERVHLTLDNSQAVLLHDLTIEDLPADDVHSEGADHDAVGGIEDDHADEHLVHVATGPGETGLLEFTPTEPGEYAFYCTVAGHREAGMEGTLLVE